MSAPVVTFPDRPRPAPLTDATLAREATLTERDRVELDAFWRQYGTPLLLAFLRAE